MQVFHPQPEEADEEEKCQCMGHAFGMCERCMEVEVENDAWWRRQEAEEEKPKFGLRPVFRLCRKYSETQVIWCQAGGEEEREEDEEEEMDDEEDRPEAWWIQSPAFWDEEEDQENGDEDEEEDGGERSWCAIKPTMVGLLGFGQQLEGAGRAIE